MQCWLYRIQTLQATELPHKQSKCVYDTCITSAGLDRVIAAHDNNFRFGIWLTSYVLLILCMAFFVHNVLAKYIR